MLYAKRQQIETHDEYARRWRAERNQIRDRYLGTWCSISFSFGSRAGHFQYIDTWRRVVLEYRSPIPLIIPLIQNYLHTSKWATCDLDPVSRCYRQSSGRGLNNSPRTAAPDFEAETTHGKIKVCCVPVRVSWTVADARVGCDSSTTGLVVSVHGLQMRQGENASTRDESDSLPLRVLLDSDSWVVLFSHPVRIFDGYRVTTLTAEARTYCRFSNRTILRVSADLLAILIATLIPLFLRP